MTENAFLSALQKATTGALPLQDMIAATQGLTQTGQFEQARQLYQVWLAMNGDNPLAFIARFNCSTLLSQLGDVPGAEAMLHAALKQNPDFAPAHINLGTAMERRGAVKDAVEQWKAGLERLSAINGDGVDYKITLLKQISRVMTDNQQQENAEGVLLQCLDLLPDQREVLEQYAAVRLAQCKWPIADVPGKIGRDLFLSRFHPLSVCAYADDPLLQLAVADHYVRAAAPESAKAAPADRRHAAIEPGRRLRIGYVSSDLRAHAVGYLMAQLFEAHDAKAVEIFVYYCGIPASDAIALRVKAAAEHWSDIRAMSDDEAAQRIGADGIDILVDVNGHTRDARLGVFARRPAPIQVNWLGYPGSMASPFHHYIIADEWIIPEDAELYYSERVLRLPCYQPNDRKRSVADKRPTRQEAGLPEDGFVFCCFNAPHKITRYSFDRWLDILRQTPSSVLWLLDYNSETNARLRAYASEHGIASERLVFAPKTANPLHLARYPLADLFLDTLPYGAHTTASDALWTGVPVLTWSGRSFASRVCGSLVRAAGAPELVCETAEHFVARAVALAGPARGELASLRERLIAGRDTCALFDIDRLARELEALYARMRDAHGRGALPRPALDNLPAYLAAGVSFDHDAIEIGNAGDYHGLYLEKLARLHTQRPMQPDGRLWTEAAIKAAEARPLIAATTAARDAA